MDNYVGVRRESVILLAYSGIVTTEIETSIAHPILFILFFSLLMYAGGINNASRERKIAKYTLTPTLRKILFLRLLHRK